MSRATPGGRRESPEYEIRPYEPADSEAFRSLFERVLGGRAREAWFDWKYRANPYVDRVPIFLAETGGEVVGARAFLPLALRVEGEERLAFQPCDTAVAPDHRRRGLFTGMTEAALDRYADAVDCYFNFPNRYSLPGNRKLGWEVVAERETYYRIQNPAAWLSEAVPVEPPDRLGDAAATAGRRAARSYFAARERLASSATTAPSASSEEAAAAEGIAVRWHDRVPPELLASLADAGEPRRIHVARDERFYRWRFDTPTWTYRTVVASADGPAAALVVGERTRPDGTRVVQLADVVPLAGSPERDRALSALLPAVLDEHADADVILAEADGLPESLLSAHGFHGDRRPPLSWVATPTVQVARPADGGDWTLAGRSLDDPDDWRLALCARDSH